MLSVGWLPCGRVTLEFVTIIGVDESTVTNWERNRTTPMLWALPRIIEYIGYDPSVSNPNTLGGRLLRHRQLRGMTQKDLARRIGIDPATLSRLERNQGRCLKSVMKKLAVFRSNSTVQDEESGGE